MEDDATVEEMRKSTKPKPALKRSFMSPGELLNIRTVVLRVSQRKLGEQLLNPSNGQPCSVPQISYWETGSRAVPLWAARRIRDLAEAAKRYDAKREGMNEILE